MLIFTHVTVFFLLKYTLFSIYETNYFLSNLYFRSQMFIYYCKTKWFTLPSLHKNHKCVKTGVKLPPYRTQSGLRNNLRNVYSKSLKTERYTCAILICNAKLVPRNVKDKPQMRTREWCAFFRSRMTESTMIIE